MRAPKITESKAGAKHRYGLMLEASLWERIVDAHWKQRKSINRLIIEALEKAFNA